MKFREKTKYFSKKYDRDLPSAEKIINDWKMLVDILEYKGVLKCRPSMLNDDYFEAQVASSGQEVISKIIDSIALKAFMHGGLSVGLRTDWYTTFFDSMANEGVSISDFNNKFILRAEPILCGLNVLVAYFVTETKANLSDKEKEAILDLTGYDEIEEEDFDES